MMKNKITKLDNGDFQVEDIVVYGIRKPKKEEETIREMLRPIHRTSIDKTPICISDPKEYYDTNKRVNQTVRDLWDKPIKRNRKEQLTPEEIEYRHDQNKMKHDIDILNEIIRDAKQRIALYKQLDKGLWASIFRTDNSEPIREEEKLIEEWQRMITEIEIWTSRYDN